MDVLATSALLLAQKMLQYFCVVAEESAQLGPYRVRKLVYIGRWRWNLVGLGLASREPVPRVGFLDNHWSRWPLRTFTKGLVGIGVPNMTSLTLKEVARTLGLTFVITLGVVELYGESVGAEVWDEGMARHVALMTHAVTIRLTHRPDASTSDADMVTDLAVELAQT
ncbi:hypothetical protein BHM03_00030651 [Ensete ventricosum]|nr:hypothetical protein BHM03_00030651 [Ensete ventricosum]